MTREVGHQLAVAGQDRPAAVSQAEDAVEPKTSTAESKGRGQGGSPYVSPKQLTQRWQLARSTVDRIARRAGFRKLALGTGRNGAVRYLLDDVLAYEHSRLV
jgi:hypothetical protein